MALYKKLRQRLFETQRGCCAACVRELKVNYFVDDPYRSSIVKMDRSLPVSYENSILLCATCAGYSANYPSLEDFYENYIVLKKGKKVKEQTTYPETISRINSLLSQKRIESGMTVEVEYLSENSKYKFAPPDVAERIAKQLFKQHKERGLKRKNEYKHKKAHGYKCSANFLMEAQNHRCCYCHTRFHDNHHSLRYATYEHVIPRREGGSNHRSNLVMACAICNWYRDRLDMSAEDFYYWVQDNPHRIQQEEKAIMQKRSTKGKWQRIMAELVA